LFLSSGNNVRPVQDMTRRCVTIHLSPECEVPAARSFQRPDLVREVLRERERFVAAALTIVLAWIQAGRPQSECHQLAGFAEWCQLCQQPLMWLGVADPTLSVFEAIADDPDRELLRRLLREWEAVFGPREARVRDALWQTTACRFECAGLEDALRDIAEERGEINRRKLGWWMCRHEGRVVDGRRFVRASGNRSAQAWRVESVSLVSSVLEASSAESDSDVNEAREDYRRATRGA
jgi:hypothetical protein